MLVLGLLVLSVANLVHLVVLAELFESLPFCWDRVLPQRPPGELAEVLVAAQQQVVELRAVNELGAVVVLVAAAAVAAFDGWAGLQLLVLV